MPTVKSLLLGDTGVGKTCLAQRFVNGDFTIDTVSTIGASSLNKTITNSQSQPVTFHIWDTAGQERYRSLTPMYFNGAGVAFLVFDITNRASFECLRQFHTLIKQRAPENIVLVLVGNKIDMESARAVQSTDAEDYAREIGAAFYLETSAKDGTNVDGIFRQTADISSLQFEPDVASFAVNLDPRGPPSPEKKSCC